MKNKRIFYFIAATTITCLFITQVFASDKNYYRNEVRHDAAKQERRASKVQEIKTSECELGKSLIDVHGNRVRLEEYVLRPRQDQIELLALTKRENRLDYMYFLYTFNKNLPDDFSEAAKEGMKWYWENIPSYWLTEFESKQSNTADYIKQVAAGGNYEQSLDSGYNQYFTNLKLMLNADSNIKEESAYNPGSRAWNFYYYPNGIRTEAKSWDFTWNTANNIFTLTYYDGDFINGSPTGSVIATTDLYSSATKLQYKMTTTYSDGKFLTRDNYIINDKGEVCTIPSVWTENYLQQILSTGNFELITTATEFQNRDIDIIWSPKILMDGGLVNVGE